MRSAKELTYQTEYFRQYHRPLLLDYLEEEHKRGGERVAKLALYSAGTILGRLAV